MQSAVPVGTVGVLGDAYICFMAAVENPSVVTADLTSSEKV